MRVVGWVTLDEYSFSFRTRVSSEEKGPWTVCGQERRTKCCERSGDMEGNAMVIDKTTTDVLFLNRNGSMAAGATTNLKSVYALAHSC